MSLSVGPADNPPYMGKLINLISEDVDAVAALKKSAASLPEIVLTPRQLCDLELLMNGGFSPLTGFLNEDDYNG